MRHHDWPAALRHAQDGLKADPSDESCAVLLASAYAHRHEPGDLLTAIEGLRRFVARYPGNLKSEDYLRTLLQRQKKAELGTLSTLEDEPNGQTTVAPQAETDAAWLAFAHSVRAWATPAAQAGTGSASSSDALYLSAVHEERVLPLPQALRRALALKQWDAEVPTTIDAAAQQEFPLETRLWRFLQAVQTGASAYERERAQQSLQAWLDTEKANSSTDDSSWPRYLDQRWAELQPANAEALLAGAAWLDELLTRHQPLPAPLMV